MKTRILPIVVLQSALILACSGCQVFRGRDVPDVVDDVAVKARVYAWNPPGLVVNEKFAAFADYATGKRQVPVKKIDLLTQQVGLRDFVDRAYGMERIRIMPEKDRAVLRTSGLLEEFFPLPMVTRYGLGDVLVTNGDSVGLVDWTMAKAEFDPVGANADPTNKDSLRVSISGLVDKPGDYVITPNAPFTELTTDQFRLGTLAGDRERVAGDFVKSGDVLIPDLYIVTRVNKDAGRLQKFYIPLQGAEEYGEEDHGAIDSGEDETNTDRFAIFDNFRLQDGDSIEVTRTEFIPELVRSRVSESTENVVSRYRRNYRQRTERARRTSWTGRLRTRIGDGQTQLGRSLSRIQPR